MKKIYCLLFFVLMTVASAAWAYGSGSSSKVCAKPEFNNFSPSENANVAVGSDFSFVASTNTYPNTIKVTVKGLPSVLMISPRKDGSFQVSGTFPASLKDVYARIAITADGQNNCKGEGGWLVKISE